MTTNNPTENGGPAVRDGFGCHRHRRRRPRGGRAPDTNLCTGNLCTRVGPGRVDGDGGLRSPGARSHCRSAPGACPWPAAAPTPWPRGSRDCRSGVSAVFVVGMGPSESASVQLRVASLEGPLVISEPDVVTAALGAAAISTLRCRGVAPRRGRIVVSRLRGLAAARARCCSPAGAGTLTTWDERDAQEYPLRAVMAHNDLLIDLAGSRARHGRARAHADAAARTVRLRRTGAARLAQRPVRAQRRQPDDRCSRRVCPGAGADHPARPDPARAERTVAGTRRGQRAGPGTGRASPAHRPYRQPSTPPQPTAQHPSRRRTIVTTATIAGLDTAPTTTTAIIDWVNTVADLTTPDTVVWCDGSDDEWRRLTTLLVDKGTFVRAVEKAQLLLVRVGPRGCRTRGGPHLHLLAAALRCRAHQQLDGSRRHENGDDRGVSRRHGRAHHVCDRVLHGAAGCRRTQVRCADHRLRIRRGLHADHDPLGNTRVEQARHRRRLRPMPALGRRTPVPRAARRAVAVRPHQIHHPLPRGAHDLELRLRLRRQRPARQEVLLAAHRLEDGPARKAGWPSTC